MEFTVESFTARLRELMYDKFPNLPNRGTNPNGTPKHKDHNQEIRDVAFKRNPTVYIDENTRYFDIGNAYAEEFYPYYHILEDSPVIRKRNKGNEKTKGSQASVEVKGGQRDYGIVRWTGKSFVKEYAKNVRGKRKQVVDRSQRRLSGQRNIIIHRGANSYKNEHYQYIENMLNGGINSALASEFGLETRRTESTGLREEYVMQEFGILQILQSFE